MVVSCVLLVVIFVFDYCADLGIVLLVYRLLGVGLRISCCFAIYVYGLPILLVFTLLGTFD